MFFEYTILHPPSHRAISIGIRGLIGDTLPVSGSADFGGWSAHFALALPLRGLRFPSLYNVKIRHVCFDAGKYDFGRAGRGRARRGERDKEYWEEDTLRKVIII